MFLGLKTRLLRVWDIGKQLAKAVLPGHDGAVWAVAITPTVTSGMGSNNPDRASVEP